jgi:hypothetical protein
MTEPEHDTKTSAKGFASFGLAAACLLAAAINLAIWQVGNGFAAGIALFGSIFFGLLGLDLLLVLLVPQGRALEALRIVVGIPLSLIALLARFSGAVLGIITSLAIWFYVCAVTIAFATRVFSDAPGNEAAALYIAALSTITFAAYAGERLLLPVKWISHKVRGGRNAIAGYHDSVRLLHAINFRRLAYACAILGYIASVIIDLGAAAPNDSWEGVFSVSMPALLSFLALDSYVAAFHPRLLSEADGK